MQVAEYKPLAPEQSTRPTAELLAFSWRFVLARLGLFAGFSALLIASIAAAGVAPAVVEHILGRGSDHLSNGAWFAGNLVSAGFWALIVGPIWAGITGIVFRLLDNDPEAIKGFSVLQSRYSSIVAVSLLCSVPPLLVGYVLRVMLPDVLAGGLTGVVTLIVDAAFVLALPAVVRFGVGPADAIAYSVRRFASKPIMFLGYYLGAVVLSLSGLLACGFGVLITLGVLFVAPALLMLEPRTSE